MIQSIHPADHLRVGRIFVVLDSLAHLPMGTVIESKVEKLSALSTVELGSGAWSALLMADWVALLEFIFLRFALHHFLISSASQLLDVPVLDRDTLCAVGSLLYVAVG